MVLLQPGRQPGPDVSRQTAAFTARARCSTFPIPGPGTRTAKPKRPDLTTKPQLPLPLLYPPEREPDDMTSVQHLGENGNLHHLIQYLGNPDATIVSGERFIVPTPGTPPNQRISFNATPALYRQDNSYVISRQGKPPDLVMEIA